jgi:hypothetical protein
MQADWFGSIVNRISYKNLSMSFQVDIRQGGHLFSLDQYYGQASGLYPNTVFVNDLGNPVRNSLANGGGLILPGVVNTGTATNPNYTQNTTRIDAEQTNAFGYLAYPASQFIYDASYVKLREVALTYSLRRRIFFKSFTWAQLTEHRLVVFTTYTWARILALGNIVYTPGGKDHET